MTASNHALSGALIGAFLPLPIALPVAFASHFALDCLPHYGIAHEQRNHSSTYKLIIICDLAVGISGGLVLVILHKWNMLLCGTVAYSPDMVWAWYYFRQGRTMHMTVKNRFMLFHRAIQRYERPWGITVEAAFMAIFLPLFLIEAIK